MTLVQDELLEVYLLKKQLAAVSCKCSVCNRQTDSVPYKNDYKKEKDKVPIQAEIASENGNYDCRHTYNAKVDLLYDDLSCPGYYIALNLLKARETKICKDEETETKSGLSNCDKCVGKSVKFVERTTSMPKLSKPLKSDSVLSVSCNTNNMPVFNGIMKRRNNDDHVEFLEDSKQWVNGHCFCLQNFMDSIRPPLDDLN